MMPFKDKQAIAVNRAVERAEAARQKRLAHLARLRTAVSNPKSIGISAGVGFAAGFVTAPEKTETSGERRSETNASKPNFGVVDRMTSIVMAAVIATGKQAVTNYFISAGTASSNESDDDATS